MTEEHIVKILMTEFVTYDVKHYVVEKPKGYNFIPGQATEVSINEPEWKDKKHPFTFTSYNNDLVLEFTIKSYPVSRFPNHTGMTEKLSQLRAGNELIIRDVWGTINYKGPGVFIAAGAGITPFIAILRQLQKDGEINGNKLIFSNKKQDDIILEPELKNMFRPEDLTLTLTRENKPGYEEGHIDKQILKKHINDFSTNFYLCGPKKFVAGLQEILKEMGASIDQVVFEK